MKIAGRLSFRVYKLPRPLPDNAVELLEKHALPSLEALTNDPIHGWVTGRHNLDRNIAQDTAFFGGYLRVALATAERKIPGELLRAECRMEEEAFAKASGLDRVSRDNRLEIHKAVEARLRPQALPAISSIPLVYDAASGLLYVGAVSDRQMDAVQIAFSQTFGFGMLPYYHAFSSHMLNEFSFTSDVSSDGVVNEPGVDFLTWLMFMGETHGGMFKSPDGCALAFLVEGPLHFVMQGAGAHVTSLSKGDPMVSAEAKAALLSGKKLARATVTFAIGEQSWTFVYDALSGSIRGLRLPEVEKLDAISRFQERMELLARFMTMLKSLYDAFFAVRLNNDQSVQLLAETDTWIKQRKVRS